MIFDIARHPEDTTDGGLTDTGQKQIESLILRLRESKYDYFAASPYFRCCSTLSQITTNLNINESRIISDLKLCTPRPNEWDSVFSSTRFQTLLPAAGSKYNAALILAPELLMIDAIYFESELVRASRNLPQSSRVFCISHNTMILAAYHHIMHGSLDIRERANVEHCQIYRFNVYPDHVVNCSIPDLGR